MATTIDWHTKIINVLRADMLLLQTTPIEVRQLNIDDFRKDLNALQASEAGMWADTTHIYSPPTTVAGVDLARVVSIINDYTVTFENGSYAVNITGGNSNISDVVNINNVSIRSANSAGLMDIQYMQAGAFDGAVAFKPSSIYSGTTFPVGTRAYPVNNSADLKLILEERGLKRVILMETMTVDSGTDFSDLAVTFVGDNPSAMVITVDPSADVENCQFEQMTVQGTLDGSNVFRDCAIFDVNYVNGFIHQCALFGTVTLGGGQLLIMDSYSGIAGGGPGQHPWIDMGGTGNNLALRGFSGGIGIKNCAASTSSLDFASGRLVFDSTVTGGTFWVRGVAEVEDNSVGATIYDYTITEDITYMRKMIDADEVLEDGSVDNWTIIDPDDGVTVLRTRSVTDKDGLPITLPKGSPARRTNT